MPAEFETDRPTAPARRSFLRRAKTLLRRGFATLLVLAVLGVVAGEAFAWLMPQDFSTRAGTWYGRLLVVVFFARVFQFYAAAGVATAAVLLMLLRYRLLAAASVVAALALFLPFARQYVPKPAQPVDGPTMRVLSMNLYFLNRDLDAIMRAIDEADADVIVLVEATSWSGREIIYKRLHLRYPHVDRPSADGSPVIISRLPFRYGKPPLPREDEYGPRVPLIFKLGDRELAMYGVHLVSPGHGWLVQHNRKQTNDFARIHAATTMPMVVAGDFNFTQLTPNYQFLREKTGLRSSHEIIGFGVGNTWGPRWSWMNKLPGVRIDHILLTPELTATTHRVGPDTGSDHRPVVADIGFRAK